MPFAQETISDSLWLGFPYKFYTIYTLHDFAIHFGIGTFLSDVFIIYLIYTLILIIAKKIRKPIKRGGILMKNNVKRFFTILMSLCLMLASSMTVLAADTDGEFNTEQYAAEELNTWAEEHGIGVRFENFCITPINDNTSDAEIEASVRSYVEMMKDAMDNMSIKVISQPTTRATNSYTASVESMIPAIGWGYIKQDFKATVSSSKISNISLVGRSYDTGFTLGSWEPNYSWYEVSSNKQFCQIHMKGTINYLWEGLNISKDCTFLDTFKASDSTLVDSTYLDWPD